MKKTKPRTGQLLRRFLPYYKKYWGILVFDLFCAALTTVCELVLPMIVRQITDYATGNIAALTLSFILRSTLLYLLLRIIDTVAQYYMASVGHIMGAKIESDMRHDFFYHLQKLSFTYYDSAKVGTLMSRMTNDLFDITEFSHHCPEEFFIAGVKIIASFVLLCNIHLPLTLIMFAVIPIMVVVLAFFQRRMKAGFRASREKIGELNAQVEDSLLGIRVVKSFAGEVQEQEKFDLGNQTFLKVKEKVYYVMAAFQSCTRLFDGVMYILVVAVGALFLRNRSIAAGDYIAYLMFVSTLMTSVRRIVEFSEQFQRGMTGIERFSEILSLEPDITDRKDAKDLNNVQGAISFNEVTFRYREGNREVLSRLNLEVKAGENIALVGPSGGGKTTLCSLIPRFYEITSGSITIDGVDIQSVTLASLRQNIGVVAQDVYLFSGTIRENILYGNPNATEEEMVVAAKLAGADDFIRALPDGYDSYVGERGVMLSGGQKQRVSIARVFLKNPPILILDEATSALDNESERLVQESLERLAKGRTTFTIAHRLTTVQNADRILVLTQKGIEESGTHRELLQSGGLYSEYHRLYVAR